MFQSKRTGRGGIIHGYIKRTMVVKIAYPFFRGKQKIRSGVPPLARKTCTEGGRSVLSLLTLPSESMQKKKDGGRVMI